LVQTKARPSIARAPQGLPGASRLRAVPVQDRLWLIVSDVPADQYSAERVEGGLHDLDWLSTCGLAHEAVVEHFMTKGVLVPLKMFSMFASEVRAVRHVRRRHGRLSGVLDRVAGCQEWGVRVVRDPAKSEAGNTRRPASGAEFLRRKSRARVLARQMSTGDRREAERVHRTLRQHARAATRGEHEPGWSGRAAPLLQAAYLVGGRGARFHAVARRLAREMRARGYHVAVTGPWPPYHFVGSLRRVRR